MIAFAVGGPLENYDEEGVALDPRFGEGVTFYLQAMATLPSVRNVREVEPTCSSWCGPVAAAVATSSCRLIEDAPAPPGRPGWPAARCSR